MQTPQPVASKSHCPKPDRTSAKHTNNKRPVNKASNALFPHVLPSYPATHAQVNMATPSLQVPPLRHGSGSHSLISATKFTSEYVQPLLMCTEPVNTHTHTRTHNNVGGGTSGGESPTPRLHPLALAFCCRADASLVASYTRIYGRTLWSYTRICGGTLWSYTRICGVTLWSYTRICGVTLWSYMRTC